MYFYCLWYLCTRVFSNTLTNENGKCAGVFFFFNHTLNTKSHDCTKHYLCFQMLAKTFTLLLSKFNYFNYWGKCVKAR